MSAQVQFKGQPRYQPWLGDAYKAMRDHVVERIAVKKGRGALPLIHVMGESHYISPGDNSVKDDEALTNMIVKRDALQKSYRSRFFTRVVMATEGVSAENTDRLAAWHRIAFSNFLQRPLSEPRESWTSEMIDEANASFFRQLSITRPSILAILGDRTWDSMPCDGFKVQPYDGEDYIRAWGYPYTVGNVEDFVLAIKLPHPSGPKVGLGDGRQADQVGFAECKNF